MYSPKYTITNSILKNIGTIEACKEIIQEAPLIPAYERQFQEEAMIRTVHHGTHIEGNDLSFEQAGKVIRGSFGETNAEKAVEKVGITARERDIQEVINYRTVMEFLDKQYNTSQKNDIFRFSENLIKQIHKLVVNRLVSEENQGVYRKSQVVLRDSRTGEITFRPPPSVEVPYLMEDLVVFMNSKVGREVHPVIRAAVAHYVLAAIHPFVEGNGRTARAFATLVMFVEDYDIKRLFSLEEYFDRDAEAYYGALIATSGQSKELGDRDLTAWIGYFTQGLAVELTRVREKVKKLSIDTKIRAKRGQQVALSERQIKIIEYLSENERGGMGEIRPLFPMVSEDTVLREFQALVKSNVIRKKGKTKGSYYELVK
ncbi:MAG: hypothetical protein A3D24_04190 [Candidatus Blackburnbacteria bacterium RIFCSPHIGHO2_02_FULL_39_13]|uniref:Fido domain-containing protein n=1 Tax=Candidatus Blackburnbacteria bacterium RIFCSPLOWO2_01_FULL_40_20 TaxID=1797519 RepID=A0A1G1VAJ1_9BACT|nr:MAG: hypothetical protein UT38_C0002G0020 [Microgenomates group bacterium GW2011_GWA2_39_19]OGY07377.1 MAG: hypothetical protein A2694_01965 [Candidatus Blackburnbacteria bacterium RIFCSPHIGHO2_01_FULL_40_17]OGY09857.1 MAG: hypothetical protein A3D24_04190 [Candidatus Blackburnbacteria bacterium RIFCSPHIGHO2_02_FULL_39_13]OGY12470.1 MAG: hypothetical protein A3A77_00640 [Candidatus Blackburnbacteria bacterium RIFCSPLOWO2_01_FULL_40_20]HBL52331.1 hypothetical protein [Candidatus Blackburnbact